MAKYLNLLEISDIIFDIIPEDIQKQYEKNVFGHTLTLKDQFIAYYQKSRESYTKFTDKLLAEKMILYILDKNMDEIKNNNLKFVIFGGLFI